MPFAQGSRSGLAYCVENTFGVTPTTPQLKSIPINTHSLSLNKDAIESGEIRSDRMIKFMRHGNRQIGGTIETELRVGDFDDLLQSAFFGRFSGGILKNGIQPLYLTIEDRSEDINQYRVFRGCAVNTLAVSIKPNAIVTATFGIVGKSSTSSNASIDSDASIEDTSDNQPFVSFEGTLKEGGTNQAIITGLDFQIDNGLQPTFVVGSAETPQLEYGRSNVTGTITAYYQDQTLMNKFLNETESSLEMSLSDGTNTYNFKMPRIKYSGAEVPVQNEQSRIITLPFTALLDDASDASIILGSSSNSSGGDTGGGIQPGFLFLTPFTQ